MALEQITFNIGAFNDSDAGGNNYFTNTVFEVKNQSDNTFATIYADASGATQIPQNGIDNISNSRGECNFYIDDGDFYLEVNSQQKNFNIGNLKTDFANIDEVKAYPKLSKLIGQRITTDEYHIGTGYGGAGYDVVSSSSVTPNDIDIIQGVADNGAAIVLIGENDERAESYGVYADNSNDSTDSLQRAIAQSTLGELKKPVEIYGRPIIDGLTIPAGGALNSRGGQLQGRVETSTGINCEGGFTTIDGVIVDTNATSSSNYAVTFDGDPSSFGHVFSNGRVIGENGVLIDCFEGKVYNSYFRGLETGTAVNISQYDASISELLIQDYNIGVTTTRGVQTNDLHVVRCNTGVLLREEGHPTQLVNTYLDTPFEYGARMLDQSNVTFTATYVLNVGGDAGDGKNNGSFASGFYMDGNSQGNNFFGVHFIQTDSSKWANSFNFLLGSKNHNLWAVSGAYKMSATNKERMRQQTVFGCKGQHARHNNVPRKCRDLATGVAVGASVDLVFYLDYEYPDDDFNTLLFKGDFTSRNGASKGAYGNIYIPIQYNDTGCDATVNVISGDASIVWTVTSSVLSGDLLTVTVRNDGTQTGNIAVQLERGLDAKGETF